MIILIFEHFIVKNNITKIRNDALTACMYFRDDNFNQFQLTCTWNEEESMFSVRLQDV